jgi:hypothetical protein
MPIMPGQLPKAVGSMFVTPEGIYTPTKLLQPENAEEPMLVTLSGMFTFAKLVQDSKA